MFKSALSEAWKWSAKFYFGSFSTAIASFFVFHNILKFEFVWSIACGIGLVILSFFIKFLINYFTAVNKLQESLLEKERQLEVMTTDKERKKRLTSANHYGEAIMVLKDIFSKVHYLRKQDKIEKKEMMATLLFLCNNLKNIFERRFSNNYSVSIKVLSDDVDLSNITMHAQVITLCRDAKSYKRRQNGNDVIHNIFDNTCFNEIFHNIDNPQKAHYISNNLVADRYYKNSSFKVYGDIPDSCDTEEKRQPEWSLPYKSEVVVPITPLDSTENRKQQFLGYLCVDCNVTDSFHIKYDIEMLKGIADGIFDIIKHNYNG
ncbi:hypothetical protein [Flavobacterium silvaticum]|uniref:Uncharacterized protein n=1 Tax=Flavobacterium silvaticum TaxID=1852020 RepID=A0A972FR73_9FLAO|nr:hypothetical protein [Flavobacterium silvaticum]NMH26497.1 hypothetical protein [Flavobacterium silvaticum]